MTIYIISDTHFGHKNIIKYENRPFNSVAEMDQTIVDNWNNTVNDEDTVLHLGDFSITGSKRTEEIINELKGNKTIITGNHDRSVSWFLDKGFSNAIKGSYVRRDVPNCIFSHKYLTEEAMKEFNKIGIQINIHGHSHSQIPKFRKGYINASIEHWGYMPIDINIMLREYYEWCAKRNENISNLIEDALYESCPYCKELIKRIRKEYKCT